MRNIGLRFRRVVERTPGAVFVVLVMALGLAPWLPEPYLAAFFHGLVAWIAGEADRPVAMDVARAIFHLLPWILLAYKLALDTFLSSHDR
ncbi:MAG: RND transporter [Thioalkalivibrionaceae bacterium]